MAEFLAHVTPHLIVGGMTVFVGACAVLFVLACCEDWGIDRA